MTSAPAAHAETPATEARTTARWRVYTARVLIVLVAILTAISLLAGYVRYQALDSHTVSDTAGDLIANDAIRAQIAAALTDQLYENTDVSATLQRELPAAQKGLAPVISGAMRELTERAANGLLERPRVQSLWVRSVTAAHGELIRLLDDRGKAIRTTNGTVTLDLRPLVIELGDRIAIVGHVADRIPPGHAQIVIMQADQLHTAQRLTHLLDILGRFLWIFTLGIAAVAVWLTPGRRRATVRSLAISVIVGGLLILVLRRAAGGYIVDKLAPEGVTREAVRDAWDILTALLVDGGRTIVLVGIVALVGTWLAGESRSGRSTRRELAPLTARGEIAYGGGAALLLLMVWWGPTAQFRRVDVVIAMAILLALGIWAIRRLTLREYPDAAEQPASAPFEHILHGRRGGQAASGSQLPPGDS